MKERSGEYQQYAKFLFVGENRSPLAIKNGYTWQNVPDTSPHCSRKLFNALRNIGIDPKEHEFINAWGDDGKPQEIKPDGKIVIAMGLKVQEELTKRDIKFIPIIHPAARGIWCRQDEYNKMIESKLRTLIHISMLQSD